MFEFIRDSQAFLVTFNGISKRLCTWELVGNHVFFTEFSVLGCRRRINESFENQPQFVNMFLHHSKKMDLPLQKPSHL